MAISPQHTSELAIRIRISNQASAELARRATEKGQDVDTVASELIENAINGAPSDKLASAAQRVALWDAWVAGMRKWALYNLPPHHEADDSRESIYEGRGE